MAMMKIGGKTPSNTVKGVAVNADGKLDTVRTWGADIISLFSDTVDDTSAHRTTNLDLSSYPLVSLRVTNRTGVPIVLRPLVDLFNNDNGYALTDVDGANLAIELAPNNAFAIITPADAPWLNYIKYLRMSFAASETPTASSPKVEISAVVRK